MVSPSRSYYDCYPYRRYYRVYPESVYYKKPAASEQNNNDYRKVNVAPTPEVPVLPSGQKSFVLKISTAASDDSIQPYFRITLRKDRNGTQSDGCHVDHPAGPNDDDIGKDDDSDNNDSGGKDDSGNNDPGKGDDPENDKNDDDSKGEDNEGGQDPGKDDGGENDSKENIDSCEDENKDEDKDNGTTENDDPSIDSDNNYNISRAIEIAKELKIQLQKLSDALE